MTKAVLWDMDGVLVDSGEAHFAAWHAMFAERGRQLTRTMFESTFGMANPEILRLWLGDDVGTDEIQALAARKEELFRAEAIRQVRMLPGVAPLLEGLRRAGYRQVVASSGEMANIVAVVAALGVGNRFDAIVSGAFLPLSKPDPTVFMLAAAAAGAEPQACVVVEDGVVGVEAARRAGMRCIAVTSTHPREKLAAADLVVERLSDLTVADIEALRCRG